MLRRFLLPIFLVAAATATATAGGTPTPTLRGTSAKDLAAQDCARARAHHQACVLDFQKGDTIKGTAATGDGTVVSVPTFATFDSLIRLRQDFRPEIIKSAEDL